MKRVTSVIGKTISFVQFRTGKKKKGVAKSKFKSHGSMYYSILLPNGTRCAKSVKTINEMAA